MMYNNTGGININAHLLDQAVNPAESKLQQDGRSDSLCSVVHTEAVMLCY